MVLSSQGIINFSLHFAFNSNNAQISGTCSSGMVFHFLVGKFKAELIGIKVILQPIEFWSDSETPTRIASRVTASPFNSDIKLITSVKDYVFTSR